MAVLEMKVKQIPYGAGNYCVTELGEIFNTATGKILKKKTAKTGYQEVRLWNCGSSKSFLVHRIVADAFLPDGGPEINHINGDKADNRASNLERCTRAENLRHAFLSGLRKDDVSPRRIIAKNEKTGRETIFHSIYRAARVLGISQGNICMCCKGIRPTASGYTFKYAVQNGGESNGT